MANLTAVIFDYYETLAELSSERRVRVFDELARSLGVDLPAGEAYEHWRVRTTKDALLRFGSEGRPPLDGAPPAFVPFHEVWARRSAELFRAWGVEASGEVGAEAYAAAHAEAPLYDDSAPALEALRGRYRLAVLSDADTAFLSRNVARHGLTFETVIDSESVRAYKPHVSMFREACARLGVAPEQAAYVGDSPWADMAGARNAGLRSVWVDRHGVDWPEDIEPPDTAIARLADLPQVLAQL